MVENFNQAVETPSPPPTGLTVTPFPLAPCNDPAFVLAALDLCHVFADRLCIPISSFEASDSAGRLPLPYAAASDAVQSTKWILDIYGKLGADRLKGLITKPSLEKSDGTPAGHPAWHATHPQLASRLHWRRRKPRALADAASRGPRPTRHLCHSLEEIQRIADTTHTKRERDHPCMCRASGNGETTQELLEDQILANADVGRSQLHDAVENQSLQKRIAARLGLDEIVLLLLHAGAKINQTDSMGRTALHVASRHGFIRTCTNLLDNGSSVNLVDDSGRLPAHHAADIGHDKLLRLLLKKGSDILMADNNGKTMLLLAAEKGHEEAVAMLLNPEQVDIDVDVADSIGRTALHYAVVSGNSNIVSRLLIAGGAYIDAADCSGLMPLHLAASKAADIIIAELLKNNPGVNLQDEKGKTPLHHALMTRYPSLLDHGTNINQVDNDRMTPIHYAAKSCHLPSIILLSEYRARRDIPNADGLLPGDLIEDDKLAAMEMREKLLVSPSRGEHETSAARDMGCCRAEQSSAGQQLISGVSRCLLAIFNQRFKTLDHAMPVLAIVFSKCAVD